LKVHIGFEATVNPNSAYRFFTHNSPGSDKEALKKAVDIMSQTPSAYPSDANAFGWLKKAFKGVINLGKGLVKKLLPSAGKLVGDIIAPGVGGSIGGAAGGWLGSQLK